MEEYDYEGLPEEASSITHMIAGAMAGIAEHTLTYPIDSIKTRMQVLKPHPAAVYSSFRHAIRTITTTEGHARLWRGVGSVVLGAGPAHAIYFSSYEWAKLLMASYSRPSQMQSSVDFAVAGGFATAAADAFMTPFDVVKQRMQIHGSVHKSITSCAKSILAKEGISGFFVSYPTTLLLNVPFHAIQFPVYEATSHFLNPSHQYSPLHHVISGGLAGGVAAFCTTPIDVIKTTLQTRHLSDPSKMKGMTEAIKFLLKERGPSAFLMGALPRALTFIPGTAICWSVYEYFKWVL